MAELVTVDTSWAERATAATTVDDAEQPVRSVARGELEESSRIDDDLGSSFG
jgi:hypothetical protein